MMDFLADVGAWAFLVFFIGFCIFIHELGHFLAAKWRKLHIDAFSIGFKKVWSRKVNGVEYRIGCIPIGGYVEVPQVDSSAEEIKAADGTVLPKAKPVDRVIVALAGPMFNVFFGLFLGCFVWWLGMPQDTPLMREIEVFSIDPAGPEYAGGLRKGDVITRVNGEKFNSSWIKFIEKNYLFSIGEVKFEVKSPAGVREVAFVPQVNPKSRLGKEKLAYPWFEPRIPIELIPIKGLAADKAGILKGDLLYSVDGEPIKDFSEFHEKLNLSDGRELEFAVSRNGRILKFKVKPVPLDLGPEYTRYLIGVVTSANEKHGGLPVVESLMDDCPAAAAGIKAGDVLIAVNGEKVKNIADFQNLIRSTGGKEAKVTLERDGKSMVVAVTPRLIRPYDIGVELLSTAHPSPVEQLVNTLDMTYKSLRGMIINLGNKMGMTEKVSTIRPGHMSGIVGMGEMLYKSVRQVSVMTGIYLVVVISFALAIFNLLPLPVLDGGHILFALLEWIFRRPLPPKLLQRVSLVFVFFLVALMLYVTYNDVRRLTDDFKIFRSK